MMKYLLPQKTEAFGLLVQKAQKLKFTFCIPTELQKVALRSFATKNEAITLFFAALTSDV